MPSKGEKKFRNGIDCLPESDSPSSFYIFNAAQARKSELGVICQLYKGIHHLGSECMYKSATSDSFSYQSITFRLMNFLMTFVIMLASKYSASD